jgi:hypothetical protein
MIRRAVQEVTGLSEKAPARSDTEAGARPNATVPPPVALVGHAGDVVAAGRCGRPQKVIEREIADFGSEALGVGWWWLQIKDEIRIIETDREEVL